MTFAFIGQTQAINLTQNAPKPQTIVLANAAVQVPRPGMVQTPVAGAGGQKSSGLYDIYVEIDCEWWLTL